MYFHSLVALIGTVTIGLAALPAQAEEEYDPFEETNRKIFAFNDYLDRNFFVPVARGYNAVTPVVVDTGITNMYQNALDPLTSVNDVAH